MSLGNTEGKVSQKCQALYKKCCLLSLLGLCPPLSLLGSRWSTQCTRLEKPIRAIGSNPLLLQACYCRHPITKHVLKPVFIKSSHVSFCFWWDKQTQLFQFPFINQVSMVIPVTLLCTYCSVGIFLPDRWRASSHLATTHNVTVYPMAQLSCPLLFVPGCARDKQPCGVHLIHVAHLMPEKPLILGMLLSI